jgi:hypothetical protein
MQITFTRTGLRTYESLATRGDGVTVRIPSPDRPTGMPHDLAHLIVERELGLGRGFWGCVADGAMFPGMAIVFGRRAPRAGQRSRAVVREAGQQGTEAEVLVGTLLHVAERGLDASRSVVREVLRDMWAPARPARAPLGVEEVRRVCDALREADRRWHALPVGSSLTLTWPATTRRAGPRSGRRQRVV